MKTRWKGGDAAWLLPTSGLVRAKARVTVVKLTADGDVIVARMYIVQANELTRRKALRVAVQAAGRRRRR